MAIIHRIFCTVAYVGIFLVAGSARAVDGEFDPTFAGGGRELLAFSTTGFDFGLAVRETADGKLIAAGDCVASCVARLLKNGNLDPNFGVLGLGYSRFDQFTGGPTSSQFLDMTLLPDGRMAFATLSTDFSNISVYMVLADGTGLDRSVGNGTGFIAKIFPRGPVGSPHAVIRRQSDGNFVVASTIEQTGVGSVYAVARIKADLSALDTTFGAQGIAEIAFGLSPPGSNADVLEGMALQADGKIVLGGYQEQAPTSMEVARLTTAGQRDTTFGANNDGRFYYQNAGFSTLITDIAIDAQQRVVFGGKLTTSTGNLLVGRLTAGGALDTTFAGTGYGSYQGLAPTNDQTVSALALTADSIFVASYAQRQSGSAGTHYFQVNRYNNDGTPATDFGIDGGAYSTFGDNTQTDVANSLIVTTSGIVLLGNSEVSNDFQFGIARIQNGHIFSNSFE